MKAGIMIKSQDYQLGPQLVLFDIDGTLVEEKQSAKSPHSIKDRLFNTVLNDFFNTKGIDFRHSSAEGLTDWLISERATAEIKADHTIQCSEWKSISSEITKRFMLSSTDKTFPDLKILQGVQTLLDKLEDRSISLGIATGNLKCFAEAKLAQAGLLKYFTLGGYGDKGKTRIDILKNVISKAKVKNPKNIVLVGDTIHDAKAAQMTGIRFIGVGTSKMIDIDSLNSLAGLVNLWVKDLSHVKSINYFLGLNNVIG